jgi:hypothetical protein
MYSINDTADFIIKTMEKFVDKLYPIDDNGITFDVDTKSVYKRYQVIRLCNYTFAYKLTEYEKICVLDSDLIIMKNIDELFELNAPAGLYLDAKDINANELHIRSKKSILDKITKVNGGVLIFEPDLKMFEKALKTIKFIIEKDCKYQNEILFSLMNNNTLHNLPLKYNVLNGYTAKLKKFNLKKEDVFIFHYDNTQYKPTDLIKDNWNHEKVRNRKEKDPEVIKFSISYFKIKVFNVYKDEVNNYLQQYSKILDLESKSKSKSKPKSKSKSKPKSKSKSKTHKTSKISQHT